MKTTYGISFITLIFLFVLTITNSFATDKVSVCHLTDSATNQYVLINIGARALSDHLAHGDALSFNGYCYSFENPVVSSEASQAFCVNKYGGNLASIHSYEEDAFLSSLIDPDSVGNITALIGGVSSTGFCSGPNVDYYWTDGSDWDFSNWRAYSSEPSCSGGYNPAVVQLWPNTNGVWSGWNDIPAYDAEYLNGFVCKFKPSHP